MTILKILRYPDKRLRQIAKPVKKITFKTKLLINNMFDTMYAAGGIGLAATQVNILQQIIVIDISIKPDEKQLILINPIIIEMDGSASIEEGCLSIPTKHAMVPRAQYVKVKSLDLYGNHVEFEASNLLAICIQHEIDHLYGKLFIDYLSESQNDIDLKINRKKIIITK
uniref:Peptide deformylase n=1 Tax=Candidatus Aschnera chinzeii TaxID=1485666 RepID=A0AAT9G4X9_9ENTR|nr:MAG: peptide deformylase [Candidatus Aschnera chinzeii]